MYIDGFFCQCMQCGWELQSKVHITLKYRVKLIDIMRFISDTFEESDKLAKEMKHDINL